jgi:hypothetical protein
MAQLLGLQKIICDSKTAYVRDKDKHLKGNIMEDAGGLRTSDLIKLCKQNQLKLSYSAEAINQLFSLQMFDVICGQVDRHLSNYHVTYKQKGKEVIITGVRALDNDMSFGKLGTPYAKNGFNR